MGQPNTPRDVPGQPPRKGKEPIIEDAEKDGGKDRDLVHGEGGTLELPVKPGDLSKDD